MGKYLSQRDPRWAATKIGSAPFTVGQKGCALTSLVELWQAMTGKKITAKRFIEIASDPKNFTDKNYAGGPGLILWDKVCVALGGIAFESREDGNKRSNQLKALKDPERGCLLWVNNGAHFVTLWREKKNDPKELIVCDPWYGDLEEVFKVYHNITGARYFKKV